MTRGPWDLRTFLLQQILVLSGALSLILSSCGPLRESPYKSAFYQIRRTAPVLPDNACRVSLVPESAAFVAEGPVLVSAMMVDSLKSATSTVAVPYAKAQFLESDCLVALDVARARILCSAVALREPHLLMVGLVEAGLVKLQLVYDNDLNVPADHCSKAAITTVRSGKGQTVAPLAREAVDRAWPLEP